VNKRAALALLVLIVGGVLMYRLGKALGLPQFDVQGLSLGIGNFGNNMTYSEMYSNLRGLRNNNPGNIEKGDNWRGMALDQPDDRFITFKSPEYGIRAIGRILKNYQRRHGINTVRGIINRWAPSFENNTDAYVYHVAHKVGVSPDQEITVADHLTELTTAIIKHENGVQPYPESLIAAGLAMA
jgi:hypothetical protein